MKNTDIAKIRHFLKRALESVHKENCSCYHCEAIQEALALLPCPTCNGTGRKIILQPGQREFGGDASTSREIPCPDCQPKPCPTCNDSGKVPYVPIGGIFPDPHTPGPCPDCQQHFS